MIIRQGNQERIKRAAHSATAYVSAHIEAPALSYKERVILQDITFRLMTKYFNGRELELLTKDYLRAEAIDIVLERNAEVTNILAIEAAIAQLIIELDKFFKEHD